MTIKSFTMATMMLVASSNCLAEQLASIDVFTISGLEYGLESQRLQLQANAPVTVHRIDAIYQFQQELSANLPGDESQAMVEVQRRLGKVSKSEIERIYGSTVNDVALANKIGVDKVPAVVFNRKYIVYGVDPLRAFEIFEKKRLAAQLN